MKTINNIFNLISQLPELAQAHNSAIVTFLTLALVFGSFAFVIFYNRVENQKLKKWEKEIGLKY